MVVLTDAGVLRHLVDRGLLETVDVVDGEVQVLDASRRNRNCHVLAVGRQGYVVKQGVNPGASGTVAREAEVYGILKRNDHQGTILGLPIDHGWDGRVGTFVVQHIEGAVSLREYQHESRATPVDLAECMGEWLGRLHALELDVAHARRHGLSSDLPEVFHLNAPMLETVDNTSVGMCAFLAVLQRSDELASGIDHLAKEWSPSALIHGDPRWDNWLVMPTQEHGRREVTLIDWEYASFGDPLWDIGSLLGEYLGAWILGAPELPGVRLDASVSLSDFDFAGLQEAMRAAWGSYCRSRGVATLEGSAERAAQYSALKLVQTAAERTHRATEISATVAALAQIAANIMSDPRLAARDLLTLTDQAVISTDVAAS